MLRLILLFSALWLAACGEAPRPHTAAESERPTRVVSLDYCADQYLLKLADKDQILAISPDAVKDFSYMRDAAHGVATVRPIAEDILTLKPDLVIRSYGGGPNAVAFFRRAGIPVLQIGFSSDVDGEDVGSIPGIIGHVAGGLGQQDRGGALITEYRGRLANIQKRSDGKNAMYMTPFGATTGPGSLVHEMLKASGLSNFEGQPGWHSLPLERLAYEQPDIVAVGFFEIMGNHPDIWSASRHPVAQKLLSDREVVPLNGAWTACGGWFSIDAIEALAHGADR